MNRRLVSLATWIILESTKCFSKSLTISKRLSYKSFMYSTASISLQCKVRIESILVHNVPSKLKLTIYSKTQFVKKWAVI